MIDEKNHIPGLDQLREEMRLMIENSPILSYGEQFILLQMYGFFDNKKKSHLKLQELYQKETHVWVRHDVMVEMTMDALGAIRKANFGYLEKYRDALEYYPLLCFLREMIGGMDS